MNIVVIKHFYKDDIECGGDYASIDIEINKIKVITFGDYYHDKGEEQAQGFIEATKHFFPDCQILHVSINDYKI